jgi:hypothetical protein
MLGHAEGIEAVALLWADVLRLYLDQRKGSVSPEPRPHELESFGFRHA